MTSFGSFTFTILRWTCTIKHSHFNPLGRAAAAAPEEISEIVGVLLIKNSLEAILYLFYNLNVSLTKKKNTSVDLSLCLIVT
jgi:hypothetical protein